MSTRWFGFDFSQLAFASSVFASPGRMSYLSKSKNTSASSGTAAKSCTAGRAVLLGAGVVVAAVGGALCTGAGAGGVAAVVLAEPVGAGAAACVVAGRLAQPLSTTAATSSDESSRCEQRVSMTSPFGVRWSVRFNGKRVSRQARRPRRTCRFARAAGDGLLGRTVGQHREDLPASVAIRLEREVTTVGRPRCALVVAGAARESARIRAVHVHDPEVVRGPARRVDERVALGRPARLRVEPARRQLPHAQPVGVL